MYQAGPGYRRPGILPYMLYLKKMASVKFSADAPSGIEATRGMFGLLC